MMKLSFDLNDPKDSSNTDKAAQNGRTPKSLTLEIYHGGCFTPTPSRYYVGGQVASINVVDIDEFCLHDLKDMVVKLGYGVADLMYYHFLISRLGLDYGLHPLNVDADLLEMAKYVKDYKIILEYVKHGSSIFVTHKKGVAIAVDNHLRKGPIEIDSSPDSASSVEGPIVVESVDDPFEDLDEILGDYANTRKQITGDDINGKQMVVHVGNTSTVDDVLDLQMLFETEEVGPIGKFKEVEVEADNESEEEMFDDDERIVEDVHVSMNNFSFTADPKHDLSIGVVEVREDDLDVIDYDLFGSDLDDGIDFERRIQLSELRRIGKQKNKGPNKYYFYLGQQFATKERVTGRVRMHSVETRRKIIMVKNDKERVRVRCEGTIPALVPYVATDTDMGKNEFSQIKGGPVIRENSISGKQNILGKDKKYEGNGIKVNKQKKVDKYSCPWTMLVSYTNEGRWELRTLIEDHNCLQSREIKACTSRFLSYHVIKSLATNPGIPMRAVQDQMEQYSLLIEYAQELINQNLGTTVRIDVQQEPNPESLTRTFRRVQILTAVEVDANNGIYPVEYAIVEAESKASWCWFLKLLGEDLGIEVKFNYTFISDRQK
ncbi:mutator type transposase, partial [Tanacetum coccineum]